MKSDLSKIFDFFKAAGNLKNTFRYKSSPKVPRESVADHAWRLTLMSFIIADELKLKINISRAMEIALTHDLAEAITDDIDALLIHNKTVSSRDKNRREDAAMKKLAAMLPKKIAAKIIKLKKEYVKRSSPEAKYIYALDKLEALAYLSEAGHKAYHSDSDFIATYADQPVNKFKKLKPVLKILKQKLKKEFKKGGFKWKKDYDKV